METRRDVFQAIADPNRRNILALLRDEQMNLNSLADNFEISRPAVSKHVHILQECGLVQITKQGRERYCRVNAKPLREIDQWLEQYRDFWNKSLDNLENALRGEDQH